MPDKILLEKAGDTATMTLNRPEQGNAVDLELMLGLIETLTEVASDKTLRLLVIEGKGDHFCSGRQPDVPRPENAAHSRRPWAASSASTSCCSRSRASAWPWSGARPSGSAAGWRSRAT